MSAIFGTLMAGSLRSCMGDGHAGDGGASRRRPGRQRREPAPGPLRAEPVPWARRMAAPARRHAGEGTRETYAAACLGRGGTELAGAERAARRLIDHNPLRETAYGMLMKTLAARGRVPEAVCVYEQACTVLRKELGIAPGPTLARLQARVVEGERASRAGNERRSRMSPDHLDETDAQGGGRPPRQAAARRSYTVELDLAGCAAASHAGGSSCALCRVRLRRSRSARRSIPVNTRASASASAPITTPAMSSMT